MKTIVFCCLITLSLASNAKRITFMGEVMDLHDKIVAGKVLPLKSPVGSYQKMVEVKNSIESFFCLYYKVPLTEKDKGKLYSFETKQPCNLKSLKNAPALFEDIKELKLFDIDLEKKMSFKMLLKRESKDEVITYFIPFISRSQSFWKGLFPIVTSRSREKGFVSFKEGDYCHQGCGELRQRCTECLNEQWTQSLSLKCANSISGRCGNNQCGARGQPACVRMTAMKQELSCDEIKEYVYCSYGREVECQNNGEVTCR